jgi:hypothetical protein
MLALLSACADDEVATGPTVSDGGGGSGGDSLTCAADTIMTDAGDCVHGGVAPEDCPPGFEAFEHGCAPSLPDEPCASGTMALAGETSCRAVADCGAAPWGNIPLEPGALYVDIAYQGGNNDGSESAPFNSIQDALDVVTPGGLIAIAEGEYVDALFFAPATPARLWGRCPGLVSVRAPGNFDSIYVDQDDTELHTMAFTGATFGVLVESARGIVLDRLWIHDTGDLGMLLSGANSPGEIAIRDTLIERAAGVSISAISVTATIERTVVREGIPAFGTGGRGIDIQSDAMWGPAVASISASLVENVGEVGVAGFGADLEVRGSIIRDIKPMPGSATRGVALAAQRLGAFEGSLELHGSLLERAHLLSLSVLESSATVDNTTIRDTMAQASDDRFGDGIVVSSLNFGASLSVSRSAIAGSARAGLASFSAAVQVLGLSLSCNLIDLDGETIGGPFDFTNEGGNVCYCGDVSRECKLLSSGLEPPTGL